MIEFVRQHDYGWTRVYRRAIVYGCDPVEPTQRPTPDASGKYPGVWQEERPFGGPVWYYIGVIRPIDQWKNMGLDTDGGVVKTIAGHELAKIVARCATDEQPPSTGIIGRIPTWK